MEPRNVIEVKEEKLLFQLFFLKDDKAQSVGVKEIYEIDSGEIKDHLSHGESVFITPKRKEKLKTSLVERESATEPWYFTHT